MMARALARCVMVLGTTSGAGKSWLTTALCRHYASQGLKVAPFKAQNMSNNARVVDGGEIGSAQYFQALAANAVPDVHMNPLLLKPEADTHSQVVLMGQVSEELSRMAWRGRSASVWPQIAAALDALRAENDVVVIEGAGSPAEINLHDSDIVNMRVALHCQAACLLVTDIDRGGAFAHLYGTWALLPQNERVLIKGFVLNKFRGDESLLAPAPQMLQERTGIPTVATLPMWWQHGLPEEDGVFDDRSVVAGRVTKTVAVIAYPRISNLDEFQPLKNVPGVRLQWVRSPSELAGLDAAHDWIILPGSKATAADLAWLRAQGLDSAIAQHAAQGGAVLGICGGLQMLGEALIDTHGIDGNAPGLGLLPLVTVFEPEKTVRHTTVVFGSGSWSAHAIGVGAGDLMLPNAQKSVPGPNPDGSGISTRSTQHEPDPSTASSPAPGVGVQADFCAFGSMRPAPPAQAPGGLEPRTANPWSNLAGVEVSGYEIHHGRTAQHPAMAQAGDVAQAVLPDDLGWCNGAGNVLGIYLHGLFEDPAVLQALFGAHTPTLDSVFDGLAKYIEQHFEAGVLNSLIVPSV